MLFFSKPLYGIYIEKRHFAKLYIIKHNSALADTNKNAKQAVWCSHSLVQWSIVEVLENVSIISWEKCTVLTTQQLKAIIKMPAQVLSKMSTWWLWHDGTMAVSPFHLDFVFSLQLSFQRKVGVMYCMAGQSSEEEMYNNEAAGPALEEFLHLLGERVRLKGFNKYRAQLDTKSTNRGRNYTEPVSY